MKENYDACFAEVERWEGWHQFSDDPYDPGGATWCGLTQRAYNGWRRSHGFPIQSVHMASDQEIKDCFRESYWNPIRGDDLFSGLDMELFDISINMGPVVAARFLQQALHVRVDGWIGMETLGAMQKVADREELLQAIFAMRMSFWHRLATWWRYGVGWTNRGNGDLSAALNLLRSSKN